MKTAEELRQEIIKLGDNPDISWADYKEELLSLINQFKSSVEKKAHPDTEADGCVFCGKCGKMK